MVQLTAVMTVFFLLVGSDQSSDIWKLWIHIGVFLFLKFFLDKSVILLTQFLICYWNSQIEFLLPLQS